MHYVYILRSCAVPSQTYVGYTRDVQSRLAKHNKGDSPHTAKYGPWEVLFYCAFPNKQTALDFEKYLKSHSGKAFASKRLI